jgi:hypothetical protein
MIGQSLRFETEQQIINPLIMASRANIVSVSTPKHEDWVKFDPARSSRALATACLYVHEQRSAQSQQKQKMTEIRIPSWPGHMTKNLTGRIPSWPGHIRPQDQPRMTKDGPGAPSPRLWR